MESCKYLLMLVLFIAATVFNTESLPSTNRQTTNGHDHPHVVDFVNDRIRPRIRKELMGGDERVRKTHRERRSSGSSTRLWESTTIPYVVGSGATQSNYASKIDHALAQFSKHTCIKFVRRTNEKDYIKFIPNEGCWSYVGYSPDQSGVQEIAIDEWSCLWPDLIQHEAMHALGFWHEHQRPDRDQYVVIRRSNIRDDKLHNFDIVYDWIEAAKSEKYDAKSVMQYERSYFSKDYDKFTMELKGDKNFVLGGYELTKSDIKEINNMYCSGQKPKATTTTKKPTTTTTTTTTRKPTTTTTTTTTRRPTTTTTTTTTTKKPKRKPTTTTTTTKTTTTTTTTTTKKPTTTTKKAERKPATTTTTTTTTKNPRSKPSKACRNTSLFCHGITPSHHFCKIPYYSKGCQKNCQKCSTSKAETNSCRDNMNFCRSIIEREDRDKICSSGSWRIWCKKSCNAC